MKTFKGKGGFGGKGKGGFGAAGKPRFGGDRAPRGDRPSFGGPTEMHRAECSKCHKECEVPFRPNGKKPIYCRDCFQKDAPSERGDRFSPRDNFRRPSYDKPSYDKPYPPREREERAGGDTAKQIEALGRKIDVLIALMQKEKSTPAPASESKIPPARKAAKKALPKKKA